MDIKKLFMGGIVASVLMFLLGWLAFVKLFAGFFASHPGLATGFNRPDADMLLVYIALGNILHGFLLAFIFVKANVNTVVSGLITGGIIGLLFAGGMDSIMYGTTTLYSRTAAAADVAIVTAMWAIAGAVAGAVMGMGKKAA